MFVKAVKQHRSPKHGNCSVVLNKNVFKKNNNNQQSPAARCARLYLQMKQQEDK